MEKKRRRRLQSTGKPASYIGKPIGSHPASPFPFHGDLHQLRDLCGEAEVPDEANQTSVKRIKQPGLGWKDGEEDGDGFPRPVHNIFILFFSPSLRYLSVLVSTVE
jgi:hypothetical protein